jgi:hypothetical protein
MGEPSDPTNGTPKPEVNLPVSTHPLVPQTGPELVIGLVGPLGTNLDLVTSILQRELQNFGYGSRIIRLSALLGSISGLEATLSSSSEDRRIASHMKAGTEIRTRTRWGDIMAMLEIAKIRYERERLTKDPNTPVYKLVSLYSQIPEA